jgi:hypothetical protein
VQFSDTLQGTTTLLGDPVPVVAGVATLETTALEVGSHTLSGQFIPQDSAAFTASSATLGYDVRAKSGIAPRVSFSIGDRCRESYEIHDAMAIRVKVDADGVFPSGTVRLYVDGQPVGMPVPLSPGRHDVGVASLEAPALKAGRHALRVDYQPARGSSGLLPSSSPESLIKVGPGREHDRDEREYTESFRDRRS